MMSFLPLFHIEFCVFSFAACENIDSDSAFLQLLVGPITAEEKK